MVSHVEPSVFIAKCIHATAGAKCIHENVAKCITCLPAGPSHKYSSSMEVSNCLVAKADLSLSKHAISSSSKANIDNVAYC